MKKRIRQYTGLLSAVLAYYAVHEGAHLLYALSTGVFRQINFMGIGMQIGIYEEQMSDTRLLTKWQRRQGCKGAGFVYQKIRQGYVFARTR